MIARGANGDTGGRSVADQLRDLQNLLLFVASGGVPSRQAAVDYLDARSGLLASSIHAMLPGFLYQCGTIDRFRDFIHLYDPDQELRREFIDRMIDRARSFVDGDRDHHRGHIPSPPPGKPRSSSWDF
jgi:hypothetical protein